MYSSSLFLSSKQEGTVTFLGTVFSGRLIHICFFMGSFRSEGTRNKIINFCDNKITCFFVWGTRVMLKKVKIKHFLCWKNFNLNFQLIQQLNSLIFFFLQWKPNMVQKVCPRPAPWGSGLETVQVFHHGVQVWRLCWSSIHIQSCFLRFSVSWWCIRGGGDIFSLWGFVRYQIKLKFLGQLLRFNLLPLLL